MATFPPPHDRHFFRVQDGRMRIFLIRLHQIDAVRNSLAEYTLFKFSPGIFINLGRARAAADKDRFEAVFAHQFVDGEHAADDHVGFPP